MDEKDIWRAAHIIIRDHIDEAEFVACDCIDSMMERGDPEGEAVWKRILVAVKELQRAQFGSRDVLH